MSVQAFVVSAGATAESVAEARLPSWTAPMVIAADGGFRAAQALGFGVTAVVGDLDSISPKDRAEIDVDETDVVVFPPDKDATDLELAIDEAIARGARELCVIDAMQGRVDHFMASAMLLTAAKYVTIGVSLCVGNTRGWVVSELRPLSVICTKGTTISLVVVEDVEGAQTEGLLYPLRKDSLRRGTSRCVSNICTESVVSVALGCGTLLVVDQGIV